MPRIPLRLRLPTETAAVIKERIAEGEIRDILPGERKLAEKLHVARDTVRLALDLLEKQGIISESDKGRRRRIITPAPSTQPSKGLKRIGFLSRVPINRLPGPMLLELDKLREVLAEKGLSLHVESPSIFDMEGANIRLRDLVNSSGYDCWILYQSTHTIQAWFQKNKVPCIVRGTPHPDINLPYIDTDWEGCAMHAVNVLRRNGHKNIALMFPNRPLAGLYSAERGFKKAMETIPGGHPLILVDEGTTESTIKGVQEAMQGPNPPTALITTRSRHVLNAFSWLATANLKPGKDISIIALSEEIWFEHLSPTIAHYHMDTSRMVRLIIGKLEVIESLAQAMKQTSMVLPEFAKGDSVGPAPT